MIGHALWEEALKNLIDKNELGHGFIFFGPEGVGKKTFALSLANYLETGVFDEATGRCTDLKLVVPVGKTLGIDEAREVRKFLSLTPLKSTRRTVIIDDAHQLTTQAQNALLKTVEEPPKHSLIILIARDYELLLSTLTSRLPKMFFPALKIEEVVLWLKEKGVDETEALKLAKRSRGAPGLAWRYEFDEATQEVCGLAKALLKAAPFEIRGLLKEMLAQEDFNILELLDALIVLAKEEKSSSQRFLSSALTMRREAATFNLNSRLQLEYLLSL
jgi:DNA polymerase-3 subunit delta'